MMDTFIHSSQHPTTCPRLKLCVLTIAAVLGCSLTPVTSADDKLCANYSYTGPTIDGVIAGDSGWRSGNLYVFNNGIDTPHATFRMIKDINNSYYLGFEVNNDPTFDTEDIIIVTLAPTPTATTHRRIHIQPVSENLGNATAAPGGAPPIVSYWTNSSGNNTSWVSSTPDWISRNSNGTCKNICVTSSSPAVAGMKHYYVEMKIPKSTDPNLGVELPASGDFGLYVNIIRVKPGTQVGQKVGLDELRWPSTAPLISTNPAQRVTRVETNTPIPSEWGQSSLQGPCSGISVVRSYTNNTDQSFINLNGTNNIFSVDLQNTGDAAGTGVIAQLRTADFGLPAPADFEMYPATSPWRAPMGPSGVINSGATVTLNTPQWDVLHDPNKPSYWRACSRIELSTAPSSSTLPTTLISNAVAYNNMHFGTASFFQETAFLGTRGYEKPSDISNLQRFQLLVGTETDSEIFGKPELSGERLPKRSLAQLLEPLYRDKGMKFLRETVCGYRETNRQVIIGSTTVTMFENANCFGYLVGHDGPLSQWNHRMEGGEGGTLKQLGDNTNSYLATVEHGKSMRLSTVIEAVEEKKCTPVCGTICPKVGATLQPNDNKLAGTGFLWFGMAGVGAVAFTRRRRDRANKDSNQIGD